MAREFGQDPFELMAKWPERYKLIALAWMEDQLKVPTRTEYYLMRIAQRVHAQWSKQAIQLDDELITDLSVRMKYHKYRSKQKVSKVDRMKRSKAIWMGAGAIGQQRAMEKRHGH